MTSDLWAHCQWYVCNFQLYSQRLSTVERLLIKNADKMEKIPLQLCCRTSTSNILPWTKNRSSASAGNYKSIASSLCLASINLCVLPTTILMFTDVAEEAVQNVPSSEKT